MQSSPRPSKTALAEAFALDNPCGFTLLSLARYVQTALRHAAGRSGGLPHGGARGRRCGRGVAAGGALGRALPWYAGVLETWVSLLRSYRKVRLDIVKRSDTANGFTVLPKRWIVERTFAWLYKYRRLSKDYEYLTDTSEAMIYIAMIHLMVRRIAAKTPF